MPLKTHLDEQPSLNLTPMIDIVFLLIIFFMVGSKFTELSEAEEHLPLEVPTVAQAETLSAAPSRRVINVYRDGTITLDRQPVSEDDLRNRLTSAVSDYPKLAVIIRGDAESRFQSVARVMGICRESGISDMGISVHVASQPVELR